MSAGTVTVTHCDSNGTWLVALAGDHDLASAPYLERMTGPVWPRCTIAIIDLSEAAFIDSGIIRWLLRVEGELDALGAVSLSIVEGAPDSPSARALGLFGVRERFACFATRDDALALAGVEPSTRRSAAASAPPRSARPGRLANQIAIEIRSDAGSAQLADVTAAMIRIYTERFGQPPELAYSRNVDSQAIACVLRGTPTRTARTPASLDEDGRLRAMRTLVQHGAEAEFHQAIEEATGRTITALVVEAEPESDRSRETFVLEPRAPSATPPPAALAAGARRR